MWLDRFKTAMVSLFFGLLLCGIASALALQLVARNHHATAWRVASFAVAQPVRFWPTDLARYAAWSAGVGVLVVVCMLAAFRNAQWTFRPRRLDSSESARALLIKSTKAGPRIFGGKFGGKPFYASVEDRGLVIGPPGTGKTAFLFNQILRLMKFGQHFVCVDVKPEIYKVLAQTLATAGYRVLRINPAVVDPDADHWNPLDDIKDETEIAELCNALLPIRDPGDAHYVEARRDWLQAAVFHMSSTPGGSLPGAFNLLSSSSDPQRLLEILGRSNNATAARLARRMAAGLPGGSKPEPLMLGGLTGALRSLEYLGLPGVQDALGHSDFSVRELGRGDQPIALFLQFEEAKLNALGPLLAFMANGVLTSLITTAGDREPVFLFLDELGNMPPIPNLPQKLNTIRSRNIPTWMYFQTAEQMERQYGRGAISTFFASSDFQMVFRLNDATTRELISTLVGTTQREKVSHTRANTGMTTIRRWETASVIEPHELGQLSLGEVVVLYRGCTAKGIATPHFIDFKQFKISK